MPRVEVEVCIESLQSALNAERAGAHRIELNSAVGLGGLTPSIELLKLVKASIQIPVICMIRPRPGDFCYSHSEFELMVREAESLVNAGADGLAVGCLNATGETDSPKIQEMRSISEGKELVFHRAFDCTPDLVRAAQELIDLGVDRVLTSGGKQTAIAGREHLAELQRQYGSQLEILPGSGLNSGNVADLIHETKCTQVHGTFRSVEKTGSEFQSSINFNEMLRLEANEKYESSEDEIKNVLEKLG